jgi:indolepyruvate ferredoxin oxidoreductase alpha subunit
MSSKLNILKEGPHEEILIGNDAIVRGMIEAGVEVATTYPGSPLSGVGVRLAQIQENSGIYFEFSTNEKVALEVAATAAIAGSPAAMVMKSVGLNVASDSFVQLNMMTMPGGFVIVIGDDPGPHSSQNEQDNRYYSQLGYLPMIEPSTCQEAKDYFVFAMKYSQMWKMPVVLRMTTRICHQTGLVKFGEKQKGTIKKGFDPKLDGGYIPLPGTMRPLREKSLNNLKKWEELSNKGELLREEKVGEEEPQIGIITSGHTYAATRSALRTMGISANILKLGITYPLPHNKIIDFIQQNDKVKILEELDPFIETQVKAELFDRGITGVNLIGKSKEEDYIDLMISEYTPARLVQIFSKLLDVPSPIEIFKPTLDVPKRTPVLCPGCGHRAALYAAKKVIEKRKGNSIADIGCYSLAYTPPFELGNILYSMGAGVPAASGMSLSLPETPIMSFVGDSTFFHAAMPGIVNAVFNNHKQVLMVMDNGITAMTGHQPNPNTGPKSRGAVLPPKYKDVQGISIDDTLKAWGVKFVKRVPAYQIQNVIEALDEAFDFAEKEHTLAVVIQQEPCALMRSTAERRKRILENPFYIDQDICRNIETCLTDFACPAIEKIEGKTKINADLCIGCGCCVDVCPMLDKPIKQMEEYKRF